MDEKKSIVKQFVNNLAVIFTPAILGITFAGMLSADSEIMYDGLLGLSGGLAFESIIQVFFLSCIISILTVVFTSDRWFAKIRLLWRLIVLLVLVIAATVGFAIGFRWLPSEYPQIWAVFFIPFGLTFGAGVFAMVLKTKIEDRRYNKLLNDYKSKRGKKND